MKTYLNISLAFEKCKISLVHILVLANAFINITVYSHLLFLGGLYYDLRSDCEVIYMEIGLNDVFLSFS